MNTKENKYMDFKNSTAIIEKKLSTQPAIIKLRGLLIGNCVLRVNKDIQLYEFSSHYIFNNRSNATASIASGEKKVEYNGSIKEIT